MKARLALKLGILAIVVAAALSGCFLVQNTGTVKFDNYETTGFNCYVNGVYVGFVGGIGTGFDILYYDYTWSGGSSTTVSWAVDGPYYDSGSIVVTDGQTSTILIP